MHCSASQPQPVCSQTPNSKFALRPWIAARPTGGFSLIEVTLAIGILAFGFVAVFGLLPAGLTTFRNTVDLSTGAQIVQRVLGQMQQSDFDLLADQVLYFDDQGNATNAGSAWRTYDVNVGVNRTPTLPTQATPGNVVLISITIVTNPGKLGVSQASGKRPTLYYSNLLARNN